MSDSHSGRDSDSVLSLVRETIEGLGRLVGDHLKLARIELQADIKVYGRSLAVLAIVAAIVGVGYVMACIGMAILLGRWLGDAGGFFVVAGAHALMGAIAASVAVRHLHAAQPMRQTVQEVSRSVSALAAAGSNGNGHGAGNAGVDRAITVRSPSA